MKKMLIIIAALIALLTTMSSFAFTFIIRNNTNSDFYSVKVADPKPVYEEGPLLAHKTLRVDLSQTTYFFIKLSSNVDAVTIMMKPDWPIECKGSLVYRCHFNKNGVEITQG